MSNLATIAIIVVVSIVLLIFLYFIIIAIFYKKIPQGESLVRTGFGGTAVAFDKGLYVIPVLHKVEIMDISIKKIEIEIIRNKIPINIIKNVSQAGYILE